MERNGPVRASRIATASISASAPSPWPMMKITPYIVENQCGSSDMPQSTDEKVAVRKYRIPAGAAHPPEAPEDARVGGLVLPA